MSELSYWVSCIFDGIANGFIYGLFGVGLVLLFRANKLFNFSQTHVVSFLMVLASGVLDRLPFHIVIGGALVVSFLAGLILHVGIMRHVTERRLPTHAGEILVTFGILMIFDALSSFFFGESPRPFPSMFGEGTVKFGTLIVSKNSIGIICVTFGAILIVALFFKFTKLGLLMEAVSENALAARLRGIRASDILAFSWAFTSMLGMLGGLLIAPTYFVFPQMLIPVFAYSLISVVIGGLESPLGAVLGGLLVGVVENLASNIEWLGSELKLSSVFVLLCVVLWVRPRGIFGRADFRRV